MLRRQSWSDAVKCFFLESRSGVRFCAILIILFSYNARSIHCLHFWHQVGCLKIFFFVLKVLCALFNFCLTFGIMQGGGGDRGGGELL